MYLKDKAEFIAIVVRVVATRFAVDPATCLHKSAPRSTTSQARLFIAYILIRVHNLPYDDVIASLNYATRVTVWVALDSVTKKLARRADARLMRQCCKQVARLTKVSKTSVRSLDNSTEFLNSPLPTFSGYHPATRL